MGNALVKIFGHIATVFFGDPAVFDRFLWLKRHLKTGPLKTLDAGCGSGAFALYAAKIGNNTVGISFEEKNNKAATERAKILRLQNVHFITANLKKLDEMKKELGEFNQIICFETIEHIMNDKKLLKDFSFLLSSDGRLILTTPFKHGRFWKNSVPSPIENGDHVRVGYDAKDFKLLFENAGLKLIVEEYVSGFVTQKLLQIGQFLSRHINPFVVWVLLFPFRIFQALDPIITKVTGYTCLSIAAVGEKQI